MKKVYLLGMIINMIGSVSYAGGDREKKYMVGLGEVGFLEDSKQQTNERHTRIALLQALGVRLDTKKARRFQGKSQQDVEHKHKHGSFRTR